MRRPWQVWLAFALSLLVAVAAVGWLSYRAIESDRADALAAGRAACEELARLAMWRLDSTAATLLAQENAQPYFAYRPFYSGRELRDGPPSGKTSATSLFPSPLLTADNPQVRLYFEIDSTGAFSSPGVPPPALSSGVVPAYLTVDKVAENRQRLDALERLVSRDQLLTTLPETEPAPPLERPVIVGRPPTTNPSQQSAERPQQAAPQFVQAAEQQAVNQAALNDSDFEARAQFTQQNAANPQAINNGLFAPVDVRVTVMTPLWLDGQLLLARRVSSSGSDVVQGCWLDWEAVKRQLQATISDLLPNARLEPADPAHAEERSHRMAVLPVTLVAGQVAVPVTTRTPVRLALWLTWSLLVLAAVAVALLLRGVLALSERRAAFVSAVTHELRTPLTTFRMYVEMLAGGMVPDDEARRDYLETLGREADRLTHLVENVLAYARLERNGPKARIRRVRVAELLVQARDRLTSRVKQANFRLLANAPKELLNCEVVADPTAVEQILFNLVDNACKYAHPADDRTIELRVARRGQQVLFQLQDHGPGVAQRERKRLFQPFRKSARDAADTAPGVGLGLALSRRLALGMGGDLTLDNQTRAGACFVLILPAAAAGQDVHATEDA